MPPESVESTENVKSKESTEWAPFNHVNEAAEVVVVGLTPGRQQMRCALEEAHRRLRAGATEAEAMAAAKRFASFAGPMRRNLIDMLDGVGVADLLGLATAAALWDGASGRAHFTSALRYPVFVDGANYSGAPDMLRTPFLREQLLRWFAPEMERLQGAIFVPLGPKVAAAVEFVAREIGAPRERILSGLPHPSGANAERIAFFLGRKAENALSMKTDATALKVARAAVDAKIAMMRGKK